MSVKRDLVTWETLSRVDPLWAIASHPDRQRGGWTVDEFLVTGEREIASVIDAVHVPDGWEPHGRVLDFGCGAGRLTRALAGRFERAVGLDVSEGMLALARRVNQDIDNAEFMHNARPDLAELEERSFA